MKESLIGNFIFSTVYWKSIGQRILQSALTTPISYHQQGYKNWKANIICSLYKGAFKIRPKIRPTLHLKCLTGFWIHLCCKPVILRAATFCLWYTHLQFFSRYFSQITLRSPNNDPPTYVSLKKLLNLTTPTPSLTCTHT